MKLQLHYTTYTAPQLQLGEERRMKSVLELTGRGEERSIKSVLEVTGRRAERKSKYVGKDL